MRHHPFSRCLAAVLAAAILLNCPGPEAFAAGIQAVRPVPAGRMDAPLGGIGAMQASPTFGHAAAAAPRFEAAALPSLPGLGTPGIDLKGLPESLPSVAAPDSAEAPSVESKPAARRSWFGLFQRSGHESSGRVSADDRAKEQKAAQAAKKEREQRAKESKLIDRVLDISIALEKAENDGNINEEELRKTADKVWGLDSGPAALDPVEASQSLPGGKTQVLARGEKSQANERGPPAPKARPAKPSVVSQAVAKAVQGIAQAISAVRKFLSAAFSPVAKLWLSLPSGLRVGLATALTVGADYSARLLMPALFGFVPVAGLWVTVGLGGVVIPALALTRRSLIKQNNPALAPLVRYADVLLGVLLGAAAVTAMGVFGSDLGASLLASAQKGPGLLSLAPLLGVFGVMASLPVLYGTGHVAWGLKNKTATNPDLPLPWMYKLMLISAVITPIQLFLSLSGALPGLICGLAFYAAFSSYFRSRAKLARMTAQDAKSKPAVVEEKDWRLDLVPGPATTPAEQLKRSRIQAALWGAVIIVGSIAVVALHQFSIPAALTFAGPKLLASIKTLIPFALVGGFLAALFMRVKRVKTGPYVDAVRELASRAGLPMPRVNAGKTTGDPNAFAAGAFYHLAVVAVVGYITRLMTVREMRGILGHEISHVKYRHMLSFLLAIPFLQLLSLGAATILQMALTYWAPILWVLAVLGLTRANERMADAGGAKVTGDPRGLATGLRKLALLATAQDKMPHREGSWLYRLFLSHPDPLERVQTLGRMLK